MTTAHDLADWMLVHGRTAVSTAEAAALLDIPADQVRVRLNRLVRTNRLISPGRGLWVAVPPEHRTSGGPPALDFLDPLMSHLGREYCLGWLSAAEVHEAVDLVPPHTQVAVGRPVDDRDCGQARLRFCTRASVAALPRVRHTVATGQVWVATPEVTALQLASSPQRGAGVSSVARVLHRLAEARLLNPYALAEQAVRFPAAAVRRLGYLLDLMEVDLDTASLTRTAQARPLARPPVLDPHGPRRGDVDRRWGVQLNADVEVDP